MDVRSPFDGAWIGQAPLAADADIELAVKAARQAFERRIWSGAPLEQRLAVLERFWRLYTGQGTQLALLSARQTALPVTAALELSAQARQAGEARLAMTRTALGMGAAGHRGEHRQAGGVVAAFAAWNATQPSALAWLLPALLAGCAMILMLPPACPLDGQQLGELLAEAGLPDGVLNIIVADEAACLKMAVHRDVDWVAFSGRASIGRELSRQCAAQGKPVTLSLDSRATGILLPDADLGGVVSALRPRLFMASGQAPSNPSRLLAPRHRQAEFIEALTAMARTLQVGDPSDPATMIGPLISEESSARAGSAIAQALAAGASLALGRQGDAREPRAFMGATVVANVSADMALVRQEPRAPLAVVIPYGDLDEAIAMANSLPGRPSAAVWSEEPTIAQAVAIRLQAGHVALNPKVLAADLAAVGQERRALFSHVQVVTPEA
uniref:Aldehyde dehydrogenase n=1 Tax=Caulobacter sp. (strain K31) TaxID=366602 RepID=B0SVQ1_CAUSK